MAFVFYNSNPLRRFEIDCTVRAIAFVTGKSWDEVYDGLSQRGYELAAPFVSNHVWGSYLKRHGFRRHIIPNTCPDCYTIRDFVNDYPIGVYLLATDGHVVAVQDGDYYDTWDSGDEIPIYYWKKEM